MIPVPHVGEDRLRPIAVYGEEWTWIERTSPAFETEGRSIFEFLEWVCRESGRTLRFSTKEAEDTARSGAMVGYGRVELQPSQALRVVMLTSGLSWRQDNGVIYVSD